MNQRYRIALFAKSKSRTLYTTFFVRALQRCGCDVKRINMGVLRRKIGRRLADRVTRYRVNRFRPDALLVYSGDIQEETLNYFAARGKTAILLDDYFPVDAPLTDKLRKVDVFFHTMTGQLEEYRAAGVKRPVYLPNGVDPDTHRRVPVDSRFVSDAAFIGKAVYDDRIEFVRTLQAAVDLNVYGAGWDRCGIQATRKSVAVPDFVRICNSTRGMVGIDKTADRELYFSVRTWFVLGCGGFLVTRYIPGLERVFANHKHLVWFNDTDEALDQIQFYLQHEEARAQIARTGFDFVHAHYPFDRMATDMLNVLFRDGETRPLTDPGPSGNREAAASLTPN